MQFPDKNFKLLMNKLDAGPPPDANTLFLSDFRGASPSNRVNGAAGTLVGNAFIDTSTQELVLDGAGDWITFVGGAAFDPTLNWTLEFHTNIAAAQFGGLLGRSIAGASRYVAFVDGAGSLNLYHDSTPVGGTTVDGASHHYAFCKDNGTALWRTYKDGVQIGTAPQTVISASADNFFIGTDPSDPTGRDISGRIARVKLSNICRYPNGTGFAPPAKTDL